MPKEATIAALTASDNFFMAKEDCVYEQIINSSYYNIQVRF